MLESNGVRCWIAPRDVTPGLEWSECIIEAIKECRIMILVFTTHANDSSQIRREVERAVNHGVVILPLRVEDVIPGSALEFFIGNVHWLDALTPPLETHLRSLAGTVKILLVRMQSRDVPQSAMPAMPTAVAPPKSEVVEFEPPPKVKQNPHEGAPKRLLAEAAANASWLVGDTLNDAVVPKSRVGGDAPAINSSPAKAAPIQTPSPFQQGPSPQIPFDAPSTATTMGYRGTSTLGDISTTSSIPKTPAATLESTPLRWSSKTALILVASAVLAVVVILSVMYISHSKAPDSATSRTHGQTPQASIPPATQSSQQTTAEDAAPTEMVAPAQAAAAQASVQDLQKSPDQPLQDACDGGDACNKLGAMYRDGRGVPNDDNRAAQLFQKACDRGDAFGCSGLGFMYMSGQGVKVDHNRASESYQKACDLGSAPACSSASSQKLLVKN